MITLTRQLPGLPAFTRVAPGLASMGNERVQFTPGPQGTLPVVTPGASGTFAPFSLDLPNHRPPVNTAAPVVTPTIAVDGTVLTVMPGTWTGLVLSRSYQWQRDGVAIGGQTGLSYTWVSASDDGHNLACVETAHGTVDVSAASNSVGQGAPPAYTAGVGVTLSTWVNSNPAKLKAARGDLVYAAMNAVATTYNPGYVIRVRLTKGAADIVFYFGRTDASLSFSLYTHPNSATDFVFVNNSIIADFGSDFALDGADNNRLVISNQAPSEAASLAMELMYDDTTPVALDLADTYPTLFTLTQATPRMGATGVAGTVNGYPVPTITRSWFKCDGAGNNPALIPGETTSSLIVDPSYAASTVKYKETATNLHGSASSTSPASDVIEVTP